MQKIFITLKYKGKEYNLKDDHEYEDLGNAIWLWEEGNFGCDCNRSQFIKEQCDMDFPLLECGETIDMTSFHPLEIASVDGLEPLLT